MVWTQRTIPAVVLLCLLAACGGNATGDDSTNLTPLARWPSLSDWETFQGNIAHTGYVPVTLDPTRFSPRWNWNTSAGGEGSLSPPVIANGLVYISSSPLAPSLSTTRKLIALRESDHTTQWEFDFGSPPTVNPPAISGGKVFVATSGQEDTFMWSFDAATGAQLSKTAFGSQWEHYYAPTIEGGVVYTNCGKYGGMCAFNLASGTQKWFAAQQQYDEWTPAIDQDYAYSYIGGVLTALVKSTGQVAFTITDPKWEEDMHSMYGSPVLGTNGAVIAVSGGNIFHDNHLMSFNTATRGLNWSVTGRYGGNPVLANGVVYATTIAADLALPRVEARSEATGALFWSWTPPSTDDRARSGMQGSYSDLLVTDNLLFVSTDRHVYALDLATLAPVWSYGRGGNMAISANGVLYIASTNNLGAVNLK